MKQKLILLAGAMGSGKDTIREEIIKRYDIKNEYHLSFAKPLRSEANAIILAIKEGVSDEKISEKFNIHIEDVKKIKQTLGKKAFLYPEFDSNSRDCEMRSFLQLLGTDIRRKAIPNYWVDLARTEIVDHLNKGYTVILTDGRFANEFDLIKELGGVLICLRTNEDARKKRVLDRDGIIPSKEALNHKSEQDWKDYEDFDIAIDTSNLSVDETMDAISIELAKL